MSVTGRNPQLDAKRCPIDFNHESPEHAKNWAEEFRRIRETCPMAWSRDHGGFWVATSYADIIRIAQDPETFTSGKSFDPDSGEVRGGLAIPPMPVPRAIPDETDNPEWTGFRRFINPRLGPAAVEKLRPVAREYAAALLDRVIESGRFDIIEDFTNPLPALVTMHLFGFPSGEWHSFAEVFHKLNYIAKGSPDFAVVVEGLEWVGRRIAEEVELRRQEPRDDFLSHMATGTIDGERLSDATIQQMAFNLLAGGLDTTTALTSNALLHLSRRPDERERLIANPDMLPIAREEFVRYVSPVHGLGRNVSRETVLNGQTMLPGERVLLSYAAGNRDPEIFANPDEVVLDRFPNRHIGFGAGIHRCVGSFLARVMFESMIQEIMARIPDYRVIESEMVQYPSISSANGWISMPATFTPGPRIGTRLLPMS